GLRARASSRIRQAFRIGTAHRGNGCRCDRTARIHRPASRLTSDSQGFVSWFHAVLKTNMFILEAPQGVSDSEGPDRMLKVSIGAFVFHGLARNFSEGIYRNSQVFPNEGFL